MDRRTFIRATGATAMYNNLTGCSGLQYVPNRLENNQIVFEQAAFADRRCVGLEHPRLVAPIAVCKLDDGQLSAVSAECTHKGCELRQSGDKLECPCHGSQFSLTGEVLSKPASQDLRRFSVQSDERYVYVGA